MTGRPNQPPGVAFTVNLVSTLSFLINPRSPEQTGNRGGRVEVPWERDKGARLVGLVPEATEDCCSQVNNASWAHAQSVCLFTEFQLGAPVAPGLVGGGLVVSIYIPVICHQKSGLSVLMGIDKLGH